MENYNVKFTILKRHEYRKGAFWEAGQEVELSKSKALELEKDGIIEIPFLKKEKKVKPKIEE